MQAAISCTGVRKLFPNVAAVDGVSLSVAPGEVFGIVGPDGAGKTTLIRMLCGILDPSAGQIEVLGAKIPNDVDEVISSLGYMSQRFSLYGDLTVLENIHFFADIHEVPRREREERLQGLLRASRLEPFRTRLAQNLSGGMKQKLALVCTLIHTPKVLFLDEPTTGVDPISRREFWQILYALVADGMTLFVSTPYMDEADRCQRLALMNRGKILVCDTPANVRSSMKNVVIEIDSPEPRAASAALAHVDGIRAIEAFGHRLHATADPSVEIATVRMCLEKSQVPFDELKLAPPSLEDAFIARLEEGEPVV
ncbi:MAG: ABC transporter ATP-binding protein [Fimbriimonas sp.]|nr:ABC transporter ATP-binding protein [Fimbriimonas sp.]